MANDWFQFKRFLVRQEDAAMKVTTDAVLLGAWARMEDDRLRTADGGKRTLVHMLDVGTGTGLLALMLAQRFPEALIEAVEIDALAYRQACQNVASSPWPERIRVIGADFLKWRTERLFDLVVCNPPFFSQSLRAPGQARSLARHDDHLPLDRLVNACAGLLKPAGSMALMIPADRFDELLSQGATSGLYLTRVLRVRGTPRSKIKRTLVQLDRQPMPVESGELVIRQEAGGAWTEDYRILTESFYL